KATPGSPVPNVELWSTPPDTHLQLLRLAGAFPAFAPDGKRLALTGGSFGTVDVMNLDGSERQTIFRTESRGLFSISRAHHGNRIGFSHGSVFQRAEGKVDLVTLRPDGSDVKDLTADKGNNGFPSFCPDGKQLLFRSGRDGSKNLYIMNADGTEVRRLTE